MTIKYHESLVRRVGGLIYVPAIASMDRLSRVYVARCRVLGQGVTPRSDLASTRDGL